MNDKSRGKSKKNCGNSSNLRLEAVKVTLEKKRESNSRALEIVTTLSESTVVEDLLLKNLHYINQEQYQDIVEERAINKLCGYPLCSNNLKNIPTKQFHISTLHNKVFDITDRKNFCRNLCYKASKYLKDQILTSPVWLRDDIVPSIYKLISLQSNGGTAGDEIDFGIRPLKAELDETSKSDKLISPGTDVLPLSSTDDNSSIRLYKTSCTVKTQTHGVCNSYFAASEQNDQTNEQSSCSLKSEQKKQIDETVCRGDKSSPSDVEFSNLQKLNSNPCVETELVDSNDKLHHQDDKQDTTSTTSLLSNSDMGDNVPISNFSSLASSTNSKSSDSSVVVKTSKKKKSLKINSTGQLVTLQNVVLKIEGVLKEWFTLESLCFLFSEEKVKEMLSEKTFVCKEWQNVSGSKVYDNNFYERYLAICRRLNILELEDTRTGASFREEIKKPLPNYEALKEQAKELEFKVKMFYKGDKVVQFQESENSTNCDSTSVQEPVLPLVDLHAQKALRRRIVLDKLRRALQDLQVSLGLRGFNLSDDVRALVSTFRLSAHNITMKPAEWNLMIIVLIKLLSIRDKSLEQGLRSEISSKHLALLLMSYSLDSGYLDRLVCWLTDIDLLIQKE